eukprot:NODE_38_length_30618_cov_0.377142.p14 type:complete len:205 gc:universal NODE_38_length_30618_cov_0.377142:17639-18253(+)
MLVFQAIMCTSFLFLLADIPLFFKSRLLLGLVFSLSLYSWEIDTLCTFFILWSVPIVTPSILLFELLNSDLNTPDRVYVPQFKYRWLLFIPIILNLFVLKVLSRMTVYVYLATQLVLFVSVFIFIRRSFNYLPVEIIYNSSFVMFDVLFSYCYFQINIIDVDYHSTINYYSIRLTIFTWIFWFIVPFLLHRYTWNLLVRLLHKS